MNIMAVDDESAALWALERAVKKVAPDSTTTSFLSAHKALGYAKDNRVDVAFLDIEMDEMNGLLLAKKLKDICGGTNIIFVTGYSDYMAGAFKMRASGYVMKPIDADRVQEELENLRNPVKAPNVGIRVQCFGNFTVFVDGEPLAMTRGKPMELLAYLVHKRGSFARTGEIVAVLWENTGNNANMRQVKSRLLKILGSAGIEDIVISDWDSMAIDVSKISCDYYDFLEKKSAGVNAYTGEYMSEYSWAEFTIGYLDNSIK